MSNKFTVESLAEKIKADNEKFEQATLAEKRVLIAQDCLERIGLRQITPKFGSFCNLQVNAKYEESVKEILDTNTEVVCTSCAKGSLFMAYLGRVNNFSVEDLKFNSSNGSYDDSHQKLLEIFSQEQLSLIEFFFEGCQYIYKSFRFNESAIRAYRDRIIGGYDHRTLDGANRLLKELCNNIIENNGTFILK